MYLFQVMNMTMRTAWSSEVGTADPWPSGCSEVRQMCSVLGSDLLLCTAPSVATPAHSPPGDTSRCSVTRAVLCNARETIRYEVACVLCNITCAVCRYEGGGEPAPRPQARGLHHPLARHQPQHAR